MASAGITYAPADVESWAAGADLSSGRGLIVKLDSTEGQVVVGTAGTDKNYGVIVTDAETSDTGAPVGVVSAGSGRIAKVKVNGNSVNIAIGDWITATTGGVGIKTTTAGDNVIGQATEAATADGLFISVSLQAIQLD